MARDCVYVDGRSNLESFVSDFLLRTGRRCFIVEEDGRVERFITPGEVKRVDRERWPHTMVDEIMQPLDESSAVTPDAPVSQALELMAGRNLAQLPVVSDGHLDGIFSRGQVAHFLQTHAELRVGGSRTRSAMVHPSTVPPRQR